MFKVNIETIEKGKKCVQSNNRGVDLLTHLCLSLPCPTSRKIDILLFIIGYCRQLTSTISKGKHAFFIKHQNPSTVLVYSEHIQKMELFAKMINDFKIVTFAAIVNGC